MKFNYELVARENQFLTDTVYLKVFFFLLANILISLKCIVQNEKNLYATFVAVLTYHSIVQNRTVTDQPNGIRYLSCVSTKTFHICRRRFSFRKILSFCDKPQSNLTTVCRKILARSDGFIHYVYVYYT